MTEISLTATGDKCLLIMSGHAAYAADGNDIVCAAASMLAQALMFGLDKLPGGLTECACMPGCVRIVAAGTAAAKAMFLMAYAGFDALAKKYPKNVAFWGEI